MTRMIAEVYVYTDESGAVLYEVVRYDPKGFSQRVPLPNGQYEYRLNGARRVPYRFAELLRRKALATVFVVEGEKDADRLRGLGFCATTSAQGAGWKWTPEFAEYFRGAKRVVVVTDSDEGDPAKSTRKGREAARERAALLRAVVDDVRFLDLDPKRTDGFDVSDWLDAGGTPEELRALVERETPIAAAVEPEPEGIEWGEKRPWPTLDPSALYGLAGEIVLTLAPETEADPAAMLFTLLVAVGNLRGPAFRSRVQDDEHPARLYAAIVGDSSAGAKGTSLATLRPILRAAAPAWFESRWLNGFGSGEAIIAELLPRDDAPLDPRLFIVEPEFARLLAVNSRDGSTQSMILRAAWDGHPLAVRRSKDRMVAKSSHLSIAAHITPNELRARLTETDATSGFANRFLFVLSRRSKKLPTGGRIDPATIGRLAKRLAGALAVDVPTELRRSPEAETYWADRYHAEPDRDGLVGALTARPAAQKLRLAIAYAALDGASEMTVEHLRAAEACWRYSVASVQHLFGSLRGDDVQDKLLEALRACWPAGMTGTEQDALFNKNAKAGRLQIARAELEERGLIRTVTKPSGEGGGRSTIYSTAIPLAKSTEKHGLTDPPELIRVSPSVLGEKPVGEPEPDRDGADDELAEGFDL